jgi:hydroxymethylglutaryl-CoA reductase
MNPIPIPLLQQSEFEIFSTANEAIINGARNGFVAATANNGAAIGKNS